MKEVKSLLNRLGEKFPASQGRTHNITLKGGEVHVGVWVGEQCISVHIPDEYHGWRDYELFELVREAIEEP